MKVLFAAHGWPPENEGGAERVAFFMAREMAKRHQVTVLHRTNQPNRPEYEFVEKTSPNYRRFTINNTFLHRPDFRWLYLNPNIDDLCGKFLNDQQFDIVHIHHLTGLSTGLVPLASDAGSKTIITLHDFWTLCPRGQRLKTDLTWCQNIIPEQCAQCVAGWMIPPILGKQKLPKALKRITSRLRTTTAKTIGKQRLAANLNAIRDRQQEMRMILGKTDLLTAPSYYMRDSFIADGVPKDHILRIPNGMDPNLFQDIPKRTPDPQNRLRIGYLGSLIPSKGIHLLIDAVAKLPPNRATLDIYGEAVAYDGYPDYGNDLKRKSAKIENVTLHGKYSNQEVGKILGSLDVVVLPSLWPENAPLTIEEAFLAQVPVVAANWGGLRERLAAGGGMLFTPGNVDSLRGILAHLVDYPDQLDTLRQNIPNVASAAEMTLVWEEIYHDLVGGPTAGT
jgi:glycosyltransferase involved in cell wall biosynthesis